MEKNKIFGYDDFLNKKRNSIKEESGYYPTGAQNDPNAPYNREDPEAEIEGKSKNGPSSGIEFKVAEMDSEYALLKDPKDPKSLYAAWIDDPKGIGLEEYRESYRNAIGKDEDGDIDYDVESGEITEESIENWIWNEVEKKDIGEGIDDLESGNFIVVKFDDEVAIDIYDTYAKAKSDEYRKTLKHFRRPASRSQKLKYSDMMDEIKSVFPDVSSEWE